MHLLSSQALKILSSLFDVTDNVSTTICLYSTFNVHHMRISASNICSAFLITWFCHGCIRQSTHCFDVAIFKNPLYSKLNTLVLYTFSMPLSLNQTRADKFVLSWSRLCERRLCKQKYSGFKSHKRLEFVSGRKCLYSLESNGKILKVLLSSNRRQLSKDERDCSVL